MARNKKSKIRNSANRPNLWGFLQNVLIAALNKGQLIGMFLGLVILLLIYKLPNDQILPLLKDLLHLSMLNSAIGWVLAAFITLSSFYINRRQRRVHTQEIRRISTEKRKLQETITKRKLPSSN